MDLICVDKSKCKKDKLCVIDCPFGLLKKGADGFPETIENARQHCIECGHCVAICPHDALTLNTELSKEYDSVDPGLKVSEDALRQLIKARRSVRHYRKQPVAREEIEKLLDVVRWTPTAKNVQPVRWIVIDGREKTQKIAELMADWIRESGAFAEMIEAWEKGYDCLLRGAPTLLVAHAAEKNFDPAVDCSIATATVELVAAAQGIGACWAGIFMMAANHHQPLIDYLDIPKGHKVYAGLMLGYPRVKYPRIPNRKEPQVRWL